MRTKFLIEIVPNTNGLLNFCDTIKNYRGTHSDTLFKQRLTFESGKTYGIISEYGQGCELLSYLLGGALSEKSYAEQNILLDGKAITAAELSYLAWEIEPYKTKYENLIVKKSIENALKNNFVSDDFDTIAKHFGLTEARYDRKLKQLSGERWFASMAIGYALGKRIFFAPYQTSSFYKQCSVRFRSAMAKLKAENCIVLFPCGTDRVLSSLVDECVFVDDFDCFT